MPHCTDDSLLSIQTTWFMGLGVGRRRGEMGRSAAEPYRLLFSLRTRLNRCTLALADPRNRVEHITVWFIILYCTPWLTSMLGVAVRVWLPCYSAEEKGFFSEEGCERFWKQRKEFLAKKQPFGEKKQNKSKSKVGMSNRVEENFRGFLLNMFLRACKAEFQNWGLWVHTGSALFHTQRLGLEEMVRAELLITNMVSASSCTFKTTCTNEGLLNGDDHTLWPHSFMRAQKQAGAILGMGGGGQHWGGCFALTFMAHR